MADIRIEASERPNNNKRTVGVVEESTAASERPSQSQQTGSTPSRTRPIQVDSVYAVRRVTWYQINGSDIRSIGIAQLLTGFFAAIGTSAFMVYLDFSKELSLAAERNESLPLFVQEVSAVAFWACLVFWTAAIFCYAWQGNEWRRIRRESGAPTIPMKVRNWWNGKKDG